MRSRRTLTEMASEPKKKRRPKGEGGIRYHAGKALWEATIDLGKDASGLRRRRTIYAKTRPQLLRDLADLKARSGGTVRPRAIGTVGEFVDRWLREDVKPNRRGKTYESYESSWRVHAEPLIGSIKLEKFDVDHVARLYETLRADGATPSAIRHVSSVMHNAFAIAVRRQAYTKANPFAIVERPTHRAREGRALTVAEAGRFIEAARDDRLEALWILCLTAGIRIGEGLGLRWSDVDFKGRAIAIQQAATQVRGRVEIGPTKTHRSRRRVYLGKLAMDALARRRRAADAEDHGSGLVFPTMAGKPLLRSNVYRSHFAPLLERAKLTGVRIHDLRHTMTSLGIAAGVVPKALAERLGHTTTRLTEDRYGHLLPGVGAGAAGAIDQMLRKRKTRAKRSA